MTRLRRSSTQFRPETARSGWCNSSQSEVAHRWASVAGHAERAFSSRFPKNLSAHPPASNTFHRSYRGLRDGQALSPQPSVFGKLLAAPQNVSLLWVQNDFTFSKNAIENRYDLIDVNIQFPRSITGRSGAPSDCFPASTIRASANLREASANSSAQFEISSAVKC